MRRVLIWLFCAASSCAAADDWVQFLEGVREKVAREITKSANYTCVQTIDRSYYRTAKPVSAGCAIAVSEQARKEMMHDRLRLDVAVSEGREIYSWHGESKFSTSSVGDVVQTGPISSGGFVGFLQNIFITPGVLFSYSGRAVVNGVPIQTFQYTVPLSKTGYHIQAKHGKPVVPFHGSFSANANNFQLTSLELIIDDIPEDSNICSADSETHYQVANISGKDSLIPELFLLRMEDDVHVYTISRNEYSQCREFGSESKLHFDVKESAAEAGSGNQAAAEPLPAGMTLRIGLRSRIDDRTSYTGDPVEGILLDGVKIPGTERSIEKNALLHGVITKLEYYYEPDKHYLIRVQFDRLTSGRDQYVLSAWPKQSRKEVTKLSILYGWPLPAALAEEFKKGLFVAASGHFHFDQQFSAEWETRRLPAPTPSLESMHE